MLTLTIDDIQVTVPPGTNVLLAAKQAGIAIPHFCFHPRLTVVASCRLCLVEIKGVPKLQPSCNVTAADGMVVRTNTPAVLAARAANLEFLLVNHPLDCPVCDRGGECPLQDFTYAHGNARGRLADEIKRTYVKKSLGPFVEPEMNRCVLCSRCVRFLDEMADSPELVVVERGDRCKIATFADEPPIRSELSGNIIDLCPVGSLTNKLFRFKCRPWELITTDTACPHCSLGCNLTVWQRRNVIHRITGRENPHVNEQWLCDRGRYAHDFVNSPDRLTTPLVRREGKLVPATWDEALSHAASLLRTGPVGGIASGRLTNEALFAFQRLMREVLGTPHLDHRVHAADPAAPSALGLEAATGDFSDLAQADVILVLGSDLKEEQPVLAIPVRRALRSGRKVIVVHPRRTDLTRRTTAYIPCPPGREADALADLLSGIAQGEARVACKALADAKRVVVLIGTEVLCAASARQALSALADLRKALTAEVKVIPLWPEGNSQGATDMGVLPYLLPGHRPAERVGWAWPEMMQQAVQRNLRTLYVAGADLLTCSPNRPLVWDALGTLDALIVQDLFLTETARQAHVVLPATTWCEDDGTFTNCAGRVQLLRKAVNPPGEARPDWRIIADLAARLGAAWRYESAADVFHDLAAHVPSYIGLSYRALGTLGVASAPRTENPQPTTPSAASAALVGAAHLTLVTARHVMVSGLTALKSADFWRATHRPAVEMSPDDAAALSLTDGQAAIVRSAHAELHLPVKVT
ncbi:MAG: NADH-quinone oxidoreductase subunit NuoG, partial [Planctomycetes bacterium]|nr:NADH-quinone oxidoreductase subunit NuoG [Planctomycetota bacterium]